MNVDEVGKYLDRFQELIKNSPQMDEQNTRSRLVDPFLQDVLGWNFYSTEVELEYSIQMGSSKKKVDYALLLDGAPAIFVEAKGCDTALDENHGEQLTSYMQQEWVDWGLLTNGKHFRLYRLQKEANKPRGELLGDTHLEEIEKNFWMIRALSKESIESGDSDTIYENVERRREAIETLSNHKNELSDDIRQLVVEQVGDVVSQPSESLAKEFVDELISEIKDSMDGQISNQTHPEPDSKSGYSVTIHSSGGTATHTEDGQKKVMTVVTDDLIQNHDLINNLPEFPYLPGEKRAMLNDKPAHPDGKEMRAYAELTDGYFLYTSLNKASKKRQLKRFADFCDVTLEFSGDW